MPVQEPLIRNISDTALWAAVYRARETERPDPIFRDPFARKLAGERGEQIARSMPFSEKHAWSWVARTYLFDTLLLQLIANGADIVINLAAGLDARPYRLDLPPRLQWIEVDLPEILKYKQLILASAKPKSLLERIALDLSDVPARRELFVDLAKRARAAVIITEGLLVYLGRDGVASLAQDLAAPAAFTNWLLDIASPGLLNLMQKNMGSHLEQSGSPLKFAPAEGPEFFTPYGWRPVEVRSFLKTAAKLGRLALWMKLLSLLPESNGKQGSRPWSAVCRLEKVQSTSSNSLQLS